MNTPRPFPAAFVVATLLSVPAANADQLILMLSTTKVFITSTYTGTDLVLFGAVQHDQTSVPETDQYDVAITVTGPRQTIMARRKERVLGIWANVDSQTFVDAPSYLAVLTNRPLHSIASAETLRQQQIGLDSAFSPAQSIGEKELFRTAILQIETERGLYIEKTNAVTFFAPRLFRAEINLPANVLVGTYDIDLKLFSKGTVIARSLSTFDVVKIGVEQFIVTSAHDYGLLYGLAVMMMALTTGGLASIIFKRD